MRWRSVPALEIDGPCNSNGCAFVQRTYITPTRVPGPEQGTAGVSLTNAVGHLRTRQPQLTRRTTARGLRWMLTSKATVCRV